MRFQNLKKGSLLFVKPKVYIYAANMNRDSFIVWTDFEINDSLEYALSTTTPLQTIRPVMYLGDNKIMINGQVLNVEVAKRIKTLEDGSYEHWIVSHYEQVFIDRNVKK